MTKLEMIADVLIALQNPGKLFVKKMESIPFTESREKSLATLTKKQLEEILVIINFENGWKWNLNYRDFHQFLESNSFEISHWSIPGQRLVFEQTDLGIYSVKFFVNDSLLIPDDQNISFEFQFDPEDSKLSLCAKTSEKTWAIDSTVVFKKEQFKDIVVKSYSQRKEMIEKIYQTNKSWEYFQRVCFRNYYNRSN